MPDPTWRVIAGDCRSSLASLPAGSVQTCVTSPPYFGLRDYGTGEWEGGDTSCDHVKGQMRKSINLAQSVHSTRGGAQKHAPDQTYGAECGKCGARRVDQQIGLEPTPDEFVAALVDVFRAVRRVLRDDGTVWLNLGDSYASGGRDWYDGGDRVNGDARGHRSRPDTPTGCKPKDLLGIPWAVAQALRAPDYHGRIRSERDRVWLAATLDAEGSICGFTHERADDGSTRTGVHLTITNTNEPLLAEADRIWPASRVEHENHGAGHHGSRPSWRWVAHGAENKALLMRELYPYLIAKREQARLAYAFCALSVDAKRLGHSPQRDAVGEKRAWIVDALSRLNRGEAVDVPAWIGEPPSVETIGWYLRSDIIWAKPNPMPESVTDRPTKAHEYLFLLSKSPRYFYDAGAIRERADAADDARRSNPGPTGRGDQTWTNGAANGQPQQDHSGWIGGDGSGRNKRSVWTVATQPFPGAHFATFPPKLIEPCILAGSSPKACGVCGAPWQRVVERTAMVVRPTPKREAWQAEDDHARTQTGGTMLEPPSSRTVGWESSCGHDDNTGRSVVLDPFAGSGTVGVVCGWHGRDFIGLELSETYAEMARDRITAEGKPWRPRSEPPKVHADQLDILSALGPG